jgi:hypothetical protein
MDKEPHPSPAQWAPENREGTVKGWIKFVAFTNQTLSFPRQFVSLFGKGKRRANLIKWQTWVCAFVIMFYPGEIRVVLIGEALGAAC